MAWTLRWPSETNELKNLGADCIRPLCEGGERADEVAANRGHRLWWQTRTARTFVNNLPSAATDGPKRTRTVGIHTTNGLCLAMRKSCI